MLYAAFSQVMESSNPNIEVQMSEIDLAEQIGRGGFGAVYKGSWRGAQVAVKYIICDVADAEAVNQSVREVVLSKKMSHPNVVQTYGFTMTAGSDLASGIQVTWLSLKWCHSPPLSRYMASLYHLEHPDYRHHASCIQVIRPPGPYD